MSEQTQPSALKTWLAQWPTVRREVEQRLAMHARHDPSLHFELTLAELELKDIDEALRRINSLSRLLYGDDLSDAELHGTGNL